MGDRARRLRDERRARWEGLCTHCGACCYEKDLRGRRVYTDFRRPCIHLNTVTHECTVYERRFDVCPLCKRMTIFHALFVSWLPESCGYVRHFRRRWLPRAPGAVTAGPRARREDNVCRVPQGQRPA
jgi:uncharacterized protein